eukprot:scaffold54551_cov39-Phaeocystis_antarctica.AAC.3
MSMYTFSAPAHSGGPSSGCTVGKLDQSSARLPGEARDIARVARGRGRRAWTREGWQSATTREKQRSRTNELHCFRSLVYTS